MNKSDLYIQSQVNKIRIQIGDESFEGVLKDFKPITKNGVTFLRFEIYPFDFDRLREDLKSGKRD